MKTSNSDLGLLQELLATANHSYISTLQSSAHDEQLIGRAQSKPDDIDLLAKLLLEAPPKGYRRRQTCLFEALNVLDLENPHSDFLAWLLREDGPLGNWSFLKAFFERFVQDVEWPGPPDSLLREVVCDLGRVDIAIEWPSFRLLIENKVWSPDGEFQATRYLKGFEIETPANGRLIHLSPEKRRPTDVSDDNLVVCIGYSELLDVVTILLESNDQMSPKGRVFLEEFGRGMERIMGLNSNAEAPNLSASSRFYVTHAVELDRIRSIAVEETSALRDWLRAGLTKTLRETLGLHVAEHFDTWQAFYDIPAWHGKNSVVGLVFCKGEGWKEGLLPQESDDALYLGVGFRGNDGYLQKKVRLLLSAKLHETLKKCWADMEDLEEGNEWGPLWRGFPLNPENSSDQLRSALNDFATKISQRLSNVLADFAQRELN